MGQHNRYVSCIDCLNAISLRLAKTTWHAVTGSGRADGHACWRCVDCERRRRAPKISNFARIKLPSREPLAASRATLPVSESAHTMESPVLRERAAALTHDGRSAKIVAARPAVARLPPRVGGFMAMALALGALPIAGQQARAMDAREVALSKAPAIVRDLHEHLARLGTGFQIAVQRSLATDLETDEGHRQALCDLRIHVAALPDHQHNTADLIVLEVHRL